MLMQMLTWLLLLPAQIEATDSADFPKNLQIRAVTATGHNPRLVPGIEVVTGF
jgi:hypothetical protein